MTFLPVTPLSGVPGLRFLEKTSEAQQKSFENQPQLKRDIAYFKENIASIKTAEELVNDRQLFRVALGAFGLDEEIGKKFFMRKMLEDGTDDPSALANRFVDPRYRKFSDAFGFGNLTGPKTGFSGFADKITDAYKTNQYEIAVGNKDPNLRLALGFKREIGEFANSNGADTFAWFSVMGNQPLRTVFEQAYSLPKAFGTLDVDKQREVFQDKTSGMFGSSSLSVFKDEEAINTLVDRFLTMAQLNGSGIASAGGSPALSILASSQQSASSAIFGILMSNSG